MIRLTSLLLVEERLLEADYFARRLARTRRDPATFGYELNTFLSAARNVTSLRQKEMVQIPGQFARESGMMSFTSDLISLGVPR